MNVPDELVIDSDLPFIWESPDTLRIGLEHPLARFRSISVAEQKFLSALRRGITSERVNEVARRCGLTALARDSVLTRVHAAFGLPARSSAKPPKAPRVCVVSGANWAGAEWTAVLAAALKATGTFGALACVMAPIDVSHSWRPARFDLAVDSADLLILPERYAVPHTEVAPWLALGVPALSVRLRDRAVIIGPVLGPPGSPCLDCCNHAEIERDPYWPVVIAQLLGTRPASETPAAALALAALTAAFVTDPGPPGRQIRIPLRLGLPEPGAESVIVTQRADCACAGLNSTRFRATPAISEGGD